MLVGCIHFTMPTTVHTATVQKKKFVPLAFDNEYNKRIAEEHPGATPTDSSGGHLSKPYIFSFMYLSV
jgi:hypothetical protein